jgi:proteasome accessory factor B
MAKKSSRTDRDLNRATLHRIHRIFERIRAGDYPNKTDLAGEIEVNARTIQRDIDFMRDFMDIPIDYDPHKYGYFFSQPVGSFPLLKLTEGELFGIFVAEKALEQYVGTPFEQPLRNTFKKFTAGLNDALSIHWSELQHAISFKSTEVNPISARLFEQLALAVRQRKKVRFDYKNLNAAEFKNRYVCPYELGCVNRQWYLFSFDLERAAIRTFALSRMKDLKVEQETFTKPKEFSVAKHLENSFGVFSGGDPKELIIIFDSFAAQLVREQLWHPSQKIRELPEDTLELSLSLGNFEEVERWLLSWSDHAKVISPPELVDRLKMALRKSLDQY